MVLSQLKIRTTDTKEGELTCEHTQNGNVLVHLPLAILPVFGEDRVGDLSTFFSNYCSKYPQK